uniref:inner nuclear membrane protein Man1-like n=1 Tax=Pristiophorus japonicus TaxID=55135 RepID=UPI00398F356C
MAELMNDKQLRRELKSLGYSAGPVTDSTRSLYVKKLKQLRLEKRQKDRSGQAPRSRQQEVDALEPAYSEPVRKRPSAASSNKAYFSRTWQSQEEEEADGVSADDPHTDYTGASADEFTFHTGKSVPMDDGQTGTSESLYSDRHTGTSESLYSDRHTGTSRNLYSDRYKGKSDSLYSDPCTRASDSLYSDPYAGTSGNLYSDPYTRNTDSLSSDPYKGRSATLYSNRYTGKSDSLSSDPYKERSANLYSDRYTGKSDNLSSDPYKGRSANLYSDRYTGKSENLSSDPYKGTSANLYSDRYTGKSENLSSDPYKGTSANLYSDRYTGKSDSLSSDRYTGKYQSLYSEPYTRKSDSLSSALYTGKYQSLNSDRYARKSESLYSDRYAVKSDSLHSDQYTVNSGSLYSDSHYRGKSDSLSANERYTRRTPAGLPKKEVQKHQIHFSLDKFRFYLSWFLYASTIVLCLVLMGLICVKTLGLIEGSQEDIGENIKMLPVDCSGKTDAFCQAEEHKTIMIILSKLYEYLAEMAGEFECGSESLLKSKCVPVNDVKRHLAILNVPNVEKFYEALQWIIQSTRDLGIRLVDEDSEAAVTSVYQVTCLESTRPQMNFYCRLRNAIFTILGRMLMFILVLSLLWIMLLLLKYQSMKMEGQQQAVYEMVNKIIAVIRAHNQDWEKDLELVPYVPVPHVRDTLIQPKDRKKMKKIWQKAVQFLEANESRIRTEDQIINGEDFSVWRWTQPSSVCDSM